MSRTQRNVPHALVDCGCEVTVYQDGSGVEIHYCPMHEAASATLEALKKIETYKTRCDSGDPCAYDNTCWIHKMVGIAQQAIAKAEGHA